MIRIVLIANLVWISFFCVAKPQSPLNNDSPDAFQSSPDVPENGAILAGVMTSMWTINEQDIGYLVVINEYKAEATCPTKRLCPKSFSYRYNR